MESYQIEFPDWQRIFAGEVPAVFFIEIIIRFIFTYILIIVCMRLMGKRMASHLSRNEMAALAALAAAVGIPLQTPERGLLPALCVALIVVGGQRIVSRWASKKKYAEALTQGLYSTLIKDGRVLTHELQKCHVSRQRVFAELRSNSIIHLGQVARLYFEANGSFCLIPEKQAKPGLSILPDFDESFSKQLEKSSEVLVCSNCGDIFNSKQCGNCGGELPVNAISSTEVD
jgi:uncharacterized membrane protein YcaP (DUF421 family)